MRRTLPLMWSRGETDSPAEVTGMLHSESPRDRRRKKCRRLKARRAPQRGAVTRREMMLDLTILTPAFVAHSGNESPVITVPAIRDLMRWWFRALVGHEAMLGLVNSEDAESRIFGSARLGIRPAVRMQVVPSVAFDILPVGSPAPRSGLLVKTTPALDGIYYVASGPVGPVTHKDCDVAGVAHDPRLNDPATGKARRGCVLRRPAIAPGSRLTVCMSWSEGALDDRQVEDLVRSAASLVALGGIGARSRKGLGALAGDIEAPSVPGARTWWESQTDGVLHGPTLSASKGFPAFPCVAYRIIRIDPVVASTWQAALGRLGQFYEAVRPRGVAAWIAGSPNPRQSSSLLFSVVREATGYRGVASILPHARPDGGGMEELRDYIMQFRETRWPDEV